MAKHLTQDESPAVSADKRKAKVIASVRVESERPLSLSRTVAAQTYEAAMGKSFASAGDSPEGNGGSFASA
eukprot:9599570-Lingulodinium_polyedra.AAC.1